MKLAHWNLRGVIIIVHHGVNDIIRRFDGGKQMLETQQQYKDRINNLPSQTSVGDRRRLVRLLALREL